MPFLRLEGAGGQGRNGTGGAIATLEQTGYPGPLVGLDHWDAYRWIGKKEMRVLTETDLRSKDGVSNSSHRPASLSACSKEWLKSGSDWVWLSSSEFLLKPAVLSGDVGDPHLQLPMLSYFPSPSTATIWALSTNAWLPACACPPAPPAVAPDGRSTLFGLVQLATTSSQTRHTITPNSNSSTQLYIAAAPGFLLDPQTTTDYPPRSTPIRLKCSPQTIAQDVVGRYDTIPAIHETPRH